MGALRIITTIVMAIFFINVVIRLIKGEMKVAAWKNGTITNEDGTKLRLKNSRSLRLSFGFLVIAMAIFLASK
jgi:large-conductance mechanosensitive channel